MPTVKRYDCSPMRHAFDRRRTNAVRSSIPLTNDRWSRRIECRRCWSRCALGRCWNRSSLGRCSLGRWSNGHWWNDRCLTAASACRTRRTTKLRMIWNDSNFRAD
jgi:hypothetical protein